MELEGNGLVPARALRELGRTIGASKVQVGIHPREAVFSSDRGHLWVRLIEGSFPKYRSLLPESYPNRIELAKEALLEALGRASLVAEDHIPVRMRLMEGGAAPTLAPERVPAGFISRLAKSGVRVALGHSMATYAETKRAMREGLTGLTHLFNAMRPLSSREPGPIAAALESENAWFGMIVDGKHVHPAMLRLAMRGSARPMLVTDAMPPVGGSLRWFTLDGQRIEARGSTCFRGDEVLAGTALDMASAVRNCVLLLGVPLASALRFASAEPARFLGLDHQLGRLAPGLRADMVEIDPQDVCVKGTWLGGNWLPADQAWHVPAAS